MSIISRLFQSKELREFNKLLSQLKIEFNNPSFDVIGERLSKWALDNPKDLKEMMDKDINHELWINGHVANYSGDLVCSGEYHMYRGVLNPVGHGENLLRLFDDSTDFAYNKGEFDKAFADEQKKCVRIGLQQVG
jgi:hypothetical protein